MMLRRILSALEDRVNELSLPHSVRCGCRADQVILPLAQLYAQQHKHEAAVEAMAVGLWVVLWQRFFHVIGHDGRDPATV